MVNNLELIKNLLKFDSEDDFYFLQILQRKKDDTDASKTNKNFVSLASYYVISTSHLDTIWSEIVILCKEKNARAYINLNKRSFEKIAFQTLMKVTNQIMNKDFEAVKSAYDAVCGVHSNESTKKWTVDIDVHDEYFIEIIKTAIANIEPKGDKVITRIPTKNGCHLITTGFNTKEFVDIGHKVEVHKDGPTVLFIP